MSTDPRYRRRSRGMSAIVFEPSGFRTTTSVTTGASSTFEWKGVERASGRSETTIDHNNGGRWAQRDSLRDRFKGRWSQVGGPFNSTKAIIHRPSEFELHRDYTAFKRRYVSSYSGPIYASYDMRTIARSFYTSGRLPTPPSEWQPYTSDDLKVMGAGAIAASRPNVSDASASQFLGEAKERLPSLLGQTLAFGSGSARKRSGGEYLNLEFGLKPFLADLQKFHESTRDYRKIVEQWERDAGRWVRRKLPVEDETVELDPVVTENVPLIFPGATDLAETGTLTRKISFRRRAWFSGAFTYWIPEKGISRRLAEFDRVYGILPDVETAWELMPWSWLIDWFTSFGDVVANANSALVDRLVLVYGYVMGHSQCYVTDSWTGPVYFGGNTPTTVTVTSSYSFDEKVRLSANPFGIGFTGADLTPRQLAILAALGLSRGR